MLQSNHTYLLVHDPNYEHIKIAWNDLAAWESPTLVFHACYEEGVMDVEWSDWPMDNRFVDLFEKHIVESELPSWLNGVFEKALPRMTPEATLSLGRSGSWRRCPTDIGETIVDVLALFFHIVMLDIVRVAE